MNRWFYVIFIFLVSIFPYKSWGCMVEENIGEESSYFLYEENRAFIESLDEYSDPSCTCDFDGNEEKEHPTSEGIRVAKRNYGQQTVYVVDSCVFSRYRSDVFRGQHFKPGASHTHPPKPGYYAFVFRYSPF